MNDLYDNDLYEKMFLKLEHAFISLYIESENELLKYEFEENFPFCLFPFCFL